MFDFVTVLHYAVDLFRVDPDGEALTPFPYLLQIDSPGALSSDPGPGRTKLFGRDPRELQRTEKRERDT